jgi:hypothetical protein
VRVVVGKRITGNYSRYAQPLASWLPASARGRSCDPPFYFQQDKTVNVGLPIFAPTWANEGKVMLPTYCSSPEAVPVLSTVLLR